MILYFLFVLLGALASVLLNLNEALPKADFSIKAFARRNWFPTVTNVVLGSLIIASLYNETSEFFVVTKLNSFILGAVAQQFVKKLCNIFAPSKPTSIGVNQYEGDEKTEEYPGPPY